MGAQDMFQAMWTGMRDARRSGACTLVTLATLCVLASPALAGDGYSHAAALAYDTEHIHQYLTEESDKLGITPSFQVSIEEVDTIDAVIDGKHVHALGDAAPTNRFGGNAVGGEARCEIRIARNAHTSGAAAATDAHEVFHCLEAQMAGSVRNFYHERDWLKEGAAEWVGGDLVRDDSVARGWWDRYFATPEKPLFTRSYDAIGFFGHLAADVISPWKVFPAMFAANSDSAAYEASTAFKPAVLTNEASEFFDRGQLGTAWTPQDQHDAIATANVPSVDADSKDVTLHSGEPVTLNVKPYADGIYVVHADSAITEITVEPENASADGSGNARLRSTDGDDVNDTDIGDLSLCTDDGGGNCGCPNQATSQLQPFHTGDLAITGGQSGATVTLTSGCAPPCDELLSSSAFPPDYPGLTSEGPVEDGTACVYEAGDSDQIQVFGTPAAAQSYLQNLEAQNYVPSLDCAPETQAIGDAAWASNCGDGQVRTGNTDFFYQDVGDVSSEYVDTVLRQVLPKLQAFPGHEAG
jgi:hypothetical protein